MVTSAHMAQQLVSQVLNLAVRRSGWCPSYSQKVTCYLACASCALPACSLFKIVSWLLRLVGAEQPLSGRKVGLVPWEQPLGGCPAASVWEQTAGEASQQRSQPGALGPARTASNGPGWWPGPARGGASWCPLGLLGPASRDGHCRWQLGDWGAGHCCRSSCC